MSDPAPRRKDSLELEIEREDRIRNERESHRRGPKGPISNNPPSMLALEQLQQIASRPSIAMDPSTLAIVNPMLLRSQRISQARLLNNDEMAPGRALDQGMETALMSVLEEDREDTELDERDEDSDEEDAESMTLGEHGYPSPPISQGDYISPFTIALQSSIGLSPVERYRYIRMAASDVALDTFLSSIARMANSTDLELARRCLPVVQERFSAHPRFVLDGGVLKQENELLVNSLGPCLFSQATTTDEGVTIPHLVALMAYCLMGSGNMREVLNEYANSGSCPLTVLTGEGSDSARTAASVKLPGLYVISPGHGLAYVGMTFSLGLATRVKGYEASEGGSRKIQAIKSSTLPFPGHIFALMWHGSTVGGFVVPAAALYAAESMVIALSGLWSSSLKDVQSALTAGGTTASLTGINTRLSDVSGAFICQPSISIAGAYRLVKFLIERHVQKDPLPEWRNDGSAVSKAAEVLYRSCLAKVFAPGTPMSTIYRHVKLRSVVTRRAWKQNEDGHLLTGFYLPGKNGVHWVKQKWKEELW